MIRTRKPIYLIGMLFILFSLKIPSGYAFLGLKSQKVSVSETSSYRILFSLTGNKETRINEMRKKEKWVEMQYKFAVDHGDSRELFDENGKVVIRFKDKDDFVIESVEVDYESLIGEREIYGKMWVKKERFKQLTQADTKLTQPKKVTPKAKPKPKPVEVYKRIERRSAAQPIAHAIQVPPPKPLEPIVDEETGEEVALFERGGYDIDQFSNALKSFDNAEGTDLSILDTEEETS